MSAKEDARPNELTSGKPREDEAVFEQRLRPYRLSEYIGQHKITENLGIYMQAARNRGEALDHVLLHGPPGLGKTTLANIIAHEMSSDLKSTSGPVIEHSGELAAILTNLHEGDIFFIDEIHRLAPAIEEILYPAMEDFELDIMIGQGPGARSVKMHLPRFTLVGATTRAGLISSPLRSRFGISLHLDFYPAEDLEIIVARSSRILNVSIDAEGVSEIARRGRGTPRIANRLLRRVRDFAEVLHDGSITQERAADALNRMEVDRFGLDEVDRKILLTIIEKFGGGPVGINTIAAAVNEEKDAIEEIYEPYLLQIGFLNRTPRGRTVTRQACAHLGVAAPPEMEASAQTSLFGGQEMT